MKTKPTLTPEETEAIKLAVWHHGKRRAKSAIRDAWFTGGYRQQFLDSVSNTLQNLRNREGGREALEACKLSSLQPLTPYNRKP